MSKNRSLNAAKRAQAGQKKKTAHVNRLLSTHPVDDLNLSAAKKTRSPCWQDDPLISMEQLFNLHHRQLLNQLSLIQPPQGYLLVLSYTPGDTAAKQIQAHATSPEAALQALQTQWSKKEKKPLNQYKVRWARLDWVVESTPLSDTQLSQQLQASTNGYYPYGLGLDADLNYLFLAPELHAHAMIYPGSVEQGHWQAALNPPAFQAYAQKKYGNKVPLSFNPGATFYQLTTQGCLLTAQGCYDLPATQPVRTIPQLDAEHTQHLINASSRFLAAQIQPNGRFVYGILPYGNKTLTGYNAMRHVGALYSLLDTWNAEDESELLPAIERGIQYATKKLTATHTINDTSLSFLVDGEEIKAGGVGLYLLMLVKYTELTQDHRHQSLMEQLAEALLYLQQPDGSFIHVLEAKTLATKEVFRTIYYDGEATFGLISYYRLTQNPRWLQANIRAFDYFCQQNHWKSHDHWLAYAVNELTRYVQDDRYLELGLKNIFGHLDFILERETYYPTLGELVMASHQLIQRIAALPEKQHLLKRYDLKKFYRALESRMHYLLKGFYWPEIAMFAEDPGRIVGSFYLRHHAMRTRIDDVQHYLSGYVAYLRHYLPYKETYTQKDGASVSASVVVIESENNNRTNLPILKSGDMMNSLLKLYEFDSDQLFRIFVDGRFHKKYDGWVGYESGEPGSVQALLNGLTFMLDNLDVREGLNATYLLDLHKVCMMGVQTKNLKGSPGDLRYLPSGMPFFPKTTSLENLYEILEMRSGDGTPVFNTKGFDKPAESLNAESLYADLHRIGRLNYRNWYPNITDEQKSALEKKSGVISFYKAKHQVQILFAEQLEQIIDKYNKSMQHASDDLARLRTIALLIRELELLHPFPDGNCRTFACVLLTQLLINYGFTPALLYNPNLDGELSLEQWIDEVKSGMLQFEKLLKDSEQDVYDYSIAKASTENKEKFRQMSAVLLEKLKDKIGDLSNNQNVKVRPVKAGDDSIYLTPDRLRLYTDGKWISPCAPELHFTGVGTYNTYRKGNVYFALEMDKWKKEGHDVRKNLESKLKRSQRALVIDDPAYANGWSVPVLLVENGFNAFKEVAKRVRQELNPFTILITGTEGKTGAKTQLYHVLKDQVEAHAVINSANTEVPILRSLAGLGSKHRVEINEVSVGSNESDRVERAKIVNPDLCLITNIGPNHMDMHKTIENILIAKSSVVEGLREGGICIVNSANDYYEGLVNAIRNRRPQVNIISFGESEQDAAQLKSALFDLEKMGWNITARIESETISYFLPLAQNHAPIASLGVLLAVVKSGYDVKLAAAAYENFEPFETMGKLVRLPKDGGTILFYDQSRRGAIAGMQSAFADLKNLKPTGRVIALVGGSSVHKDSDWTRESSKQIAEMINDSPIDRLYTTGNFVEYINDNLSGITPVFTGNDVNELAVLLLKDLKAGDLLFIIGSAYLYLGRVSDIIEDVLVKGKPAPYVIPSSAPYSSSYQLLKVYEDTVKGVGPGRASSTHGVVPQVFNNTKKDYPTYSDFRASFLLDYFAKLENIFSDFLNVRRIDESLVDGAAGGRYVASKKTCSLWFNKMHAGPNKPSIHFIGSFFDFGNPDLLIFVCVASQNLHIGLVTYDKVGSVYSLKPMSTKEVGDIYNEYKGFRQLGLEYRKWSPQWISVDLGDFMDLRDPQIFTKMVDFSTSKSFKNIVMPFLNNLSPLKL